MAYNTGYIAEQEVSLEQELRIVEETPIMEGRTNVHSHSERPRTDSPLFG